MYDDLVAVYKRDLTRQKVRRLTPKEQAQLARERRYDELAEAMLPLVLKVLREVLKDLHFDYEQDIRSDLLQAGNIAMLVAVKSWDPDAENAAPLTSWVYKSIRRDMFREFNKQRQVVTGTYPESVYGFSANFENLYSDDGVRVNKDMNNSETSLREEGVRPAPERGQLYPDELLDEAAEEVAIAEEAREHLQSALDSLPDKQRKAIVLTEIQGLSTREVGDVLGISHTYVAKLRSAALKALKERLRGRIENPSV